MVLVLYTNVERSVRSPARKQGHSDFRRSNESYQNVWTMFCPDLYPLIEKRQKLFPSVGFLKAH